MVAETKPPHFTLREYFAREDASETKSEYYDGVIVAMSGASRAHARITISLTGTIINHLAGKSCEPFNSDVRVQVPACNAVFYPDLSVVCGEPQFAETKLATLLNPTLIVEVLSPSTERTDKGVKFDCYRTVDLLSTYVLVYQDEPRVEVYSRMPDGTWRYDVATDLTGEAPISSIGCNLQLGEIYARVEFPPTAPIVDLRGE